MTLIHSKPLQKSISILQLVVYTFSILGLWVEQIYAAGPTVDIVYSANPTGTGALTVTATYSEIVVGTPLISIC